MTTFWWLPEDSPTTARWLLDDYISDNCQMTACDFCDYWKALHVESWNKIVNDDDKNYVLMNPKNETVIKLKSNVVWIRILIWSKSRVGIAETE